MYLQKLVSSMSYRLSGPAARSALFAALLLVSLAVIAALRATF